MIIVPTYLDKSPIHGFGVFAKEKIKQGTVIWKFDDRFDLKLSMEEFAVLPPSVKEEIEVHMYEPEEGVLYYETTMGKYMNHSREYNVDFALVELGTATRDIEPDEELTCDYRQFMAKYDDLNYL